MLLILALWLLMLYCGSPLPGLSSKECIELLKDEVYCDWYGFWYDEPELFIFITLLPIPRFAPIFTPLGGVWGGVSVCSSDEPVKALTLGDRDGC